MDITFFNNCMLIKAPKHTKSTLRWTSMQLDNNVYDNDNTSKCLLDSLSEQV